MSLRKPLIGLSLFLTLALVVSWMVFETLQRDIAGPTNSYVAMFTDVSGMHPGDDVRVAGVRVGRVDDVELQGDLAKVTFRVQRSQPLFTNTVASVTYQNIIGQRYLGLTPGADGDQRLLPNGGTIPVELTVASFDIAYLLNGFEPLFATLDPKQIDNITNAVVQAFQGDSGAVLTLLTQSSQITDTIAGPDEVLSQTITDLNKVVTRLAGQSSDIDKLIRQSGAILHDLDGRRDALVASLGSINATTARLATVTNAVFPDFQELIRRQPGAAAHISEHPDGFAYAAANTPAVLKGIARATEYGAYGNTYPCNINMSFFAFLSRLIPGIVRLASPGNVLRNSAVCR